MELVNHDVVEACSHLLVYERHVASVNQFVEEVCRICKEESVGIEVKVAHLGVDDVEKHKMVDMLQ